MARIILVKAKGKKASQSKQSDLHYRAGLKRHIGSFVSQGQTPPRETSVEDLPILGVVCRGHSVWQ